MLHDDKVHAPCAETAACGCVIDCHVASHKPAFLLLLRALPHASIRSLSSHYTMIPKTLADAQQSPPAQRGRCASIRSLSSHDTRYQNTGRRTAEPPHTAWSLVVVLQFDRCHRITRYVCVYLRLCLCLCLCLCWSTWEHGRCQMLMIS